jgi:hypothetical protein
MERLPVEALVGDVLAAVAPQEGRKGP